ncbi:MAG TPA: hypothetical protein VLR45_10840, partial [Desulfoprunum sp.]|nr:hypothetical protein [Desulfoprunum sp.]
MTVFFIEVPVRLAVLANAAIFAFILIGISSLPICSPEIFKPAKYLILSENEIDYYMHCRRLPIACEGQARQNNPLISDRDKRIFQIPLKLQQRVSFSE